MLTSHEPALVLTGGGARAAYQVGILKAITTCTPRAHPLPFRILCGTSAGAINAAALATYASNFRLSVKHLEQVWANFSTEQVYQCQTAELAKLLLGRVGRLFSSKQEPRSAISMFNNEPLRHLLNQVIQYPKIQRHIDNGFLRAVAITASSYSTGHSVTFFEGISQYENWSRAKRDGIRTHLSTDHLMASAAIPLLFPAAKVINEYYGDGSIHQIAPLSPALHLGASKLLIISLGQTELTHSNDMSAGPTSAAIMGHLLDTIFADTLNSDIERLNRINLTIQQLERGNLSHPSLRRVQYSLFHPHHDFNEIALHHYHKLPRSIRRLLGLVGVSQQSPSSLVSYLLFEKDYCRELIQLGYEDGMKRIDELHTFLELGNNPIR